jgi:hypothetical protein
MAADHIDRSEREQWRREEQQRQWKQNFEKGLDRLESSMIIQQENGLTKCPNAAASFKKANEKLTEAHKALRSSDEFDYASVDSLAREARMEFNNAINSAPRRWRYIYAHGYPYFALYVVAVGLVLLLFFKLDEKSKIPLIDIPIWPILFGVAGGAFRGLWWLMDHSAEYTIRKSWVVYMLVPPFAGGILGIVAYLLHKLLLTEIGAMLIAFVGGFSSEYVFHHLSNIFGYKSETSR